MNFGRVYVEKAWEAVNCDTTFYTVSRAGLYWLMARANVQGQEDNLVLRYTASDDVTSRDAGYTALFVLKTRMAWGTFCAAAFWLPADVKLFLTPLDGDVIVRSWSLLSVVELRARTAESGFLLLRLFACFCCCFGLVLVCCCCFVLLFLIFVSLLDYTCIKTFSYSVHLFVNLIFIPIYFSMPLYVLSSVDLSVYLSSFIIYLLIHISVSNEQIVCCLSNLLSSSVLCVCLSV